MNNQKEIISKINELYIIKRSKFLVLTRDGRYMTINTSENNRAFPLNDYTIQRHLEGKGTCGVFSTKRASKFICFDVDVKDDLLAKWITYKVVHSLIDVGVPQDFIHISYSGNKGYHVEIFFKQPIENYLLKEFYTRVLKNADLIECEYGDVELRPTAKQGVKLPLGKHFKTKGNKRCWYVNYEEGLKPVQEYNYILNIVRLESQIIYDILERERDCLYEEDVLDIEKSEEYIEQKYNPLPIYNQNIDNDETIEKIEEILINGLKSIGTRNNSLFKLAKYFKWSGLNQEQTKQRLLRWMKQQDKNLYTSEWEVCVKEIEHISSYVFSHDVQLTLKERKVTITYDEMKQIIKDCQSKNEKLLTYCILIHSKRYSNKSGVFYMTFKQMTEASGLGEKTVRRLVEELSNNKIIEVIERNRKQKGTHMKKPNKYRLNINQTTNNEKKYDLNINDNVYSNTFKECVTNLIEYKLLKEMLPRRQFKSIVA